MKHSRTIAPKTLIVDTLRILMIQRCLTARDLAAACGVSHRTIENEISLSVPSRPLRLKLENHLGRRLWSSPAEFHRAQSVRRALGFDPRLLSVPQLVQRAKALNLHTIGIRSKSKLISLFEAHAAVHPATNKTL